MGFGKDTFGHKKGFLISSITTVCGYLLTIIGTGGRIFGFIMVGRLTIGVGMGCEYVLAPSAISDGSNKKASTRNIGLLYMVSSTFGPMLVDIVLAIGLALDPVQLDDGNNPVEPRDTVFLSLYIVGFILAVTGMLARAYMPVVEETSKNTLPPQPFYKVLFATALGWFLYDYIEYGFKTNKTHFLEGYGSSFTNQKILPDMVNNAVYMIPLTTVSILASLVTNKNLQIMGFTWCTVWILIMALTYPWEEPKFMSTLLYITQQCGQAFLGITTMALATECFPRDFQGKALGISAAVGKIGAFIGSSVFLLLTDSACATENYPMALFIATAVAACGLMLTLGATPAYTSESRAEMQRLSDEGDHQGAVDALYGSNRVVATKPLV